jgi:predicted transposase YbfD/YdcC
MINECFGEIEDPRSHTNKIYSLEALLLIIFSAVISGYDSAEEMSEFATLKLSWLQQFVDLKRAPSAETLRFLLCALCPQQLTDCFSHLARYHNLSSKGDCIAIDGKTMRGTRHTGHEAVHIISAWSHTHGITLAALESKGKKNEIATLPDIIDYVSVQDAIFSTDAMGCQTSVADKIKSSGNDYVLQLKDNQATLLRDIQAYHHKLEREGFTADECNTFEEVDKGHGRIEVRRYTQFLLTDWIDNLDNWTGLTTAIKVERRRIIADEETQETAWYISSLPMNPKVAARAIRCHWSVENPLHWRLDVVFRDDDYSVYSAKGAVNMAIIKRFCMNLLKQQAPETKRSRTFKSKVMACAIDDNFRETALFG